MITLHTTPARRSLRSALRYPPMARLRFKWRRVVAKSWFLSRGYYRWRGTRLVGRPWEEVWYFAYGANMDDRTFRIRRGIRPLDRGVGRVKGYRLRFNLEGRPKGKAAPANLYPDPEAEVWGVFYRITRRDLMRLDATEGVRAAAIAMGSSRSRPMTASCSTPLLISPRVSRTTENHLSAISHCSETVRKCMVCLGITSASWKASSMPHSECHGAEF
jgi:hypothetical protein